MLKESHVTVSRACYPTEAQLETRRRERQLQSQDLKYVRTVLSVTQVEALEADARAWLLSPPIPPRTYLHALIWGCAKHLWAPIEASVRTSVTVTDVRHLHLHRPADFFRAVYAVDDVTPVHLEMKVHNLGLCTPEVLSLTIEVSDPKYRRKEASGGKISRLMEDLKKKVRGAFNQRVANYTHDIIIHGSDNEEVHTRHIERLVGTIWAADPGTQPTSDSHITAPVGHGQTSVAAGSGSRDAHSQQACIATHSRWACALLVMRQRNVSDSDWLVVGSSVLSGISGRLGNDLDLLVRPGLTRLRATRGEAGPTYVTEEIQVVHSNWLGSNKRRMGLGDTLPNGLSDEELLDNPRWHTWTRGSTRVKHVRAELAFLRKGTSLRDKDRQHLEAICQRPFGWDRELLAEAAQRTTAQLIKSGPDKASGIDVGVGLAGHSKYGSSGDAPMTPSLPCFSSSWAVASPVQPSPPAHGGVQRRLRTPVAAAPGIVSAGVASCAANFAGCFSSHCCSNERSACFRKPGKQYAQCRPLPSSVMTGCVDSPQWECPGWWVTAAATAHQPMTVAPAATTGAALGSSTRTAARAAVPPQPFEVLPPWQQRPESRNSLLNPNTPVAAAAYGDGGKIARLLNLTFGPSGDIAALVVEKIGGAHRSLYLLAFWLTYAPIADALIDAKQRGVDVRVLLDPRSETNRIDGATRRFRRGATNIVTYLRAHGVPTTVARPSKVGATAGHATKAGGGKVAAAKPAESTPIFHHKIIVIDNTDVCLGSANFYALAFSHHDETYLCLSSVQLATAFTTFAQRRAVYGWQQPPSDGEGANDAAACDKPPSGRLTSVGSLIRKSSTDSAVEVLGGPYFGPECPLDHIWLAHIRTARQRIRIVHWRITWAPLLEGLLIARRLGVNVSIYIDEWEAPTLQGGLSGLLGKELHVHAFKRGSLRSSATALSKPKYTTQPGSRMFHHKIILVDDDIVLVGSANAVSKSLRKDSEDLLVLRSRAIAQRVDALCEGHAQF